jgi:uncharacterized protein with PQ loop repeat
MSLKEITLGAFAACNSLRIFAYIPQVRKVATDENGASAISCTTWLLFLVAHLSTVAYAIVNRSDWGLAACFAVNAVCCLSIVAVACCKRRRQVRRGSAPVSAWSTTVSTGASLVPSGCKGNP